MDKKTIILSTVAIILIAVLVSLKLFMNYQNRNGEIIKPEGNANAIIYHSETLGIDASDLWEYEIYKTDYGFIFFKTKGEVTIAGPSEKREISKGRIETKQEFLNLEKDINKDKRANAEKIVKYYYIDNDERIECENINELITKLGM